MELLFFVKFVYWENELFKFYFGKCKFNYFGKFKIWFNGKEIYVGEIMFFYFWNING